MESRYRAHLQTAVGHENECKNNSISFAKTKEETQWNCAKKLEIQWRVQRRLSFQRIRHLSFSFSSPAAGKARERWGSQALYLAQFFWGVNANFFNCFFNEIWRINDVQRLMKGFVNLVRWRLCYLLTDFETAL